MLTCKIYLLEEACLFCCRNNYFSLFLVLTCLYSLCYLFLLVFFVGHIERRYMEVPAGATWVEATMRTSGFDTARIFSVAVVQVTFSSGKVFILHHYDLYWCPLVVDLSAAKAYDVGKWYYLLFSFCGKLYLSSGGWPDNGTCNSSVLAQWHRKSWIYNCWLWGNVPNQMT